jgi:hypothetical protein
VTEDHERIDELLAGYVLLSLSGEEAAEADRILVDHVPLVRDVPGHPLRVPGGVGRSRARRAARRSARDPPAPLHHAMDEVPLSGRTPRRGALIAVAASAVALVAMGGLSLVLGSRLSNAETRTGTALEILSAMRSPGASPVNVTPQDQTPAGERDRRGLRADIRTIYLASEFCPEAAPGHGYQLWLGSNGEWTPVGELFWPDDGVLLLEVEGVDVSRYDEIWITQEAVAQPPTQPSTDGPSWFGSLA